MEIQDKEQYLSDLIADAEIEANKMLALIKQRMSNPYASTGTPIAELNGNAKTLSQFANLGGGSKATGGEGVAGGIRLLSSYVQTEAFITGYKAGRCDR